ncbi:hypothetical protein ECC11_08110 [Helicobacter pylori]|nr:hypothetical protein ECC11_08110 [Helicobacter pylori]
MQSFNHSIIQSFNHSINQAFNHSSIQSFNHSIIQSFKHSIIQAIKQRYHTFITIYSFTKDRLKIPYFLSFPLLFSLAFPLALTHAAFLNHLIP